MPRRQTPRLSEALQQYQVTRSTYVARTTLQNDSSVLRRFVEGVQDPQVHNLGAQACEAYFAQETGRQSARSYNKVLMRVRGFLRFCITRGWLAHDPLVFLRPRKVTQNERLRLSPQQLRSLVESTDNQRDRALLAMAVNTGLRASDLVAMSVGQLDLEAGFVALTIQKTGDADRLPVTSDLDIEMRRWLAYYAERLQVHGLALESTMRLFPALGARQSERDPDGRPRPYGDPKPYTGVHKPADVVHRALIRIGIEQTAHEGFHTIRRSIGRLVFERALEAGHDGALRTTAALLGHKSTATTELYLGVRSDRVKRDALMRGQSLLGMPDESNVLQLREA